MPAKRKGESMDDYLSRCIPIVSREHPEKTHDQVVGQCAGMYRSAAAKERAQTTKRKSKAGTTRKRKK